MLSYIVFYKCQICDVLGLKEFILKDLVHIKALVIKILLNTGCISGGNDSRCIAVIISAPFVGRHSEEYQKCIPFRIIGKNLVLDFVIVSDIDRCKSLLYRLLDLLSGVIIAVGSVTVGITRADKSEARMTFYIFTVREVVACILDI